MHWIGKLFLGLAAWEAGAFAVALAERKKAYSSAVKAARSRAKSLLVVGNPYGQYGCGDVVLDVIDNKECPVHVTGTVEEIPFADKHFGAVFVSHVLEHVCEPEKALAELRRVADEVFIVYPRWYRISTWSTPGHTWLMTEPEKGTYRFHRIRKSCNLKGYFGTGLRKNPSKGLDALFV